MGSEVEAEAYRPWNARFPCNEATPFKHLHHLVDTRRRDKKVPFYVRLGRCSAKVLHVLKDEGKVFELALRGKVCAVMCRRCAWTLDSSEKSIRTCVNNENSAV